MHLLQSFPKNCGTVLEDIKSEVPPLLTPSLPSKLSKEFFTHVEEGEKPCLLPILGFPAQACK